MDWHTHITSDAGILGGRPVVTGTRLSVDFILGLFAAGWGADQVLDNYPTLTADALQGVFAYAAEVLRDETYLRLPAGSSHASPQ